jgi:hypothetical protein
MPAVGLDWSQPVITVEVMQLGQCCAVALQVSDDNASSTSLAAVDQQWRTAGGSPHAKKPKT